MKRLSLSLPTLFIMSFVFTASMAIAKDYIIYSIAHELPMGTAGEQMRKNFYVNMGSNQGVEPGSVLDIYRQVSQLDPYTTKKRYNYKFKIGELKVIHTEQDVAIGTLHQFKNGPEVPLIDVQAPMVGDQINVKVD